MKTMNRLLGATFFRTLPPRLKVALHVLELLLGLYFTTAVALKALFDDPVLLAWCVQIAIVYLAVYPFVHVLLEMLNGTGPVPPMAPPAKPKEDGR